MKRKPGALSLVTAQNQASCESSRAPLWWTGLPSKTQPHDDRWDESSEHDDNDNDDNDDDNDDEYITISEREHLDVPDKRCLAGFGSAKEERERQRSPESDGHSHLFFGVGRTPETMASWSGQPGVKGARDTTRMMLLTSASLGIAFTWGVEMTYCTPYLLSLGLTKGQASIIWLAGPLSGLIVQPVIGVVSDQSTAKWGRRRPFMVAGSVLSVLGLLLLSYTREVVTYVAGEGEAPVVAAMGSAPAMPHRRVVIAVAVMALYLLDFAINAVMSCNRSLLVDTLPLEKQQEGAAWASRMAAFGHLVGYAAGAVDLVAVFGPALGDTQFKKLSIVASASLLCTVGITCWAVTERVLLTSALGAGSAGSAGSTGSTGSTGDGVVAKLTKIFRQIWSTLRTLPPRIQAICWAVFWGWIGWFPFVVYSSTWVGETYFRYDVPAGAASADVVGEMGRIGSWALTTYSAMTVLASTVLPLLVRSPYTETFTKRPPASIAWLVEAADKARPDLLTVWTCGHVMFACSMFMAPFAHSFRFATALVTLCGIPWTVVTWAPSAFLGVEVNKLTGGGHAKAVTRPAPKTAPNRRLSDPEPGEKSDPAAVSTGELSGIYFGILNIYTTLPQLLGNLLSATVFAVLEPGKSPELAKDAHPSEHHSTDGPNAIAVTLFIGAVFALISAKATRKLARL